jgi:hypothetical protein
MDRCNDTLHLANRVFNALLLQVEPGKETTVVNTIRHDLDLGKDTIFYKGFGRYDIAIITEKSDFSLVTRFREQPYDHILDWLPVCGVKWEANDADTVSMSNHSRLAGLSQLQLRPMHQQNDLTIVHPARSMPNRWRRSLMLWMGFKAKRMFMR